MSQPVTAYLRRTRDAQALTRGDLARLIGCDIEAVRRLENGEGSTALLIRAMQALNLQFTGIGKGSNILEQIRNAKERDKLSAAELGRRTNLASGTLSRIYEGLGSVSSLQRLLNVVAPDLRPENRGPAQTAYNPDPDRDLCFAPLRFLRLIEEIWGPIDLNPCGHRRSSVRARRSIPLSETSLTASWTSTVTFVHPPIRDIDLFLSKACDEFQAGNAERIIVLAPTVTDGKVFQNRLLAVADVCLMAARLALTAVEWDDERLSSSALMSVIFGATSEELQSFQEGAPGIWVLRGRGSLGCS